MEVGRGQYKRLLEQIAECRRSGLWPGYEDPAVWTLPGWATGESGVELSVSGERIQV